MRSKTVAEGPQAKDERFMGSPARLKSVAERVTGWLLPPRCLARARALDPPWAAGRLFHPKFEPASASAPRAGAPGSTCVGRRVDKDAGSWH